MKLELAYSSLEPVPCLVSCLGSSICVSLYSALCKWLGRLLRYPCLAQCLSSSSLSVSIWSISTWLILIFSPPPTHTSLFWPQLYLCPSLSLLLKTCSGCFTWSSQRIHINSICFHSMFLFLFVYICQSSWASNPVRAHHLPSPKLS